MDTIVMKFGGSSVADNEKLKIVAQKIIEMYNKENNIKMQKNPLIPICAPAHTENATNTTVFIANTL